MGEVQEYLYNGEYVRILEDVSNMPSLVVVTNDREEYIVARRDQLQKKEDSWGYQRELERADEMRKLTQKAKENLDAVVEEVIEKATSALSSRMKMNVVFGKDMSTSGGWALMIADELNKLIKEKAPKVVKKDELPF